VTLAWQDLPLSQEFELRLSPTRTLAGGFVLDGALCLRALRRFAQLEDVMPHMDSIGQQGARSRLHSVVAVATRAVCVLPVRVSVDGDTVRFRIEASDPPHPACDAQLRLRLERGLSAWLREHWLRNE
jgi:hypothetical protein